MEKSIDLFATELAKITDMRLGALVSYLLDSLGDEDKWKKPASASGKYHPDHDNGEYGLLRHTKMVCRIMEDLLVARPDYYDNNTIDIAISAALLHDVMKYHDNSTNSDMNHPHLAYKAICEFSTKREATSSHEKLLAIADIIHSHHGQWNKMYEKIDGEKKQIGIMPYPKSELAWMLHYADYISSRKWIKADFDEKSNDVLI